jgi:protein ImuA
MAASASEIIEGLRQEIRRLERRPPPAAAHSVSSGRAAIDALLPGGGFPRGALVELCGGQASGKTAVALSALAAAMGERGLGAFVDGRGELYPPAAAALGVDLDRLLVVRPAAGPGEPWPGLWAAEALLGSGAFEAVAVDVPLEGARGRAPGGAAVDAMLRRVRTAAEKGGSIGLWLARPEGPRIPAVVRLELAADGRIELRRALACEVFHAA